MPERTTAPRGRLTTTSYAVLGLLAIRPWSTYELTQQMNRSLGRFWPRAVSKLYEEPKKLVAHGFARASAERVGARSRTVYTITPQGRRVLADWLKVPGAGPVLEFEALLKVFYGDHGTREGMLATLEAARTWARERSAESAAIGEGYLGGEGPFPGRERQLILVARFLTDFYALVDGWAEWAIRTVHDWPEDPRHARADPAGIRDLVRRARRVAARGRARGGAGTDDL